MILVTGATGTVGRKVVYQLAAAGQKVRALVRLGRGRDMRRRYVTLFDGDLDDPQSVQAAVHGVDRIYLLAPAAPDQVAEEAAVIDAAVRAGVDQIVKHSALGADELRESRFSRQHAECEHKLRESSIAWTILRPSSFMSNLLGFAPTIRREGRFYAPAGQGRVALIDPDDIAAAAVAVLTTPGHAGEVYDLTGPESLSYGDVAARIGAVIGRPVEYVDVPPEKAREAMLQSGLSEWYTDGLLELMRAQRDGKLDHVSDDFQRLVGRPPRTLDEFLREHAAAFAPPEAERPAPAP
jgi:(4-alkanoyl-5-oxo-2,5-dihydrofuran-3-yl)methyl phosphate reductase